MLCIELEYIITSEAAQRYLLLDDPVPIEKVSSPGSTFCSRGDLQ